MLLLAAAALLTAQPAQPPVRRVLILHSYQQGPVWVQNVNEGALSVFRRNPEFEYVYRFEYMNVLDADPASYAEVYTRRLGRMRFDVVIAADNQALEFLVENRSGLFAGVPIVFCSIDDYDPAMLEGQSGITGVTGDLDFTGTIRLARRLHPGMKQLLVLVNRELAAESAAFQELFELVPREISPGVAVSFLEDPVLSDLLRRAGSYPAGTVILDLAFLADDSGRPLSLPASTRRVSEALGLPMYSCWETILGHGIVGGVISGGFQQGEAAAELALRILRGADPESLPVVREGTNRPMFDHEQLRRFGIPEKRLPPGSIVINQPTTFYARYRSLLWIFLTVILALAVLLALSLLYTAGQRRMRRRIARSEERLSLALASTNSGIWEYYPRSRQAFYDPRWFTMLGYEPGAFPPEYKTWADFLHPEDRENAERTVAEAVREGRDCSLEFRMRARDGQWRWISSSGKIVERDAAGKALRLVGTHVDITERKKAEEAVRESERRYRFLYEKSPAISLVLGADGRILDVNGSFARELGFQKEEVTGRPVLEVVLPEHRDKVARQLENDLEGVPTGQIDVDVAARDGTVHTILFSGSPAILYEAGRPHAVLATGIDITERRRAQEQARLREQQLIQADKMATLGILVSGVAHEINNPNNFILLNGRICARLWDDLQPLLQEHYRDHGDFLLAGMPYSEAAEKIGRLIAGIAEGSQRIKKIVQSLREFARKDAGALDQRLRPNEVVESAVLIVHNLIEKSTARFSLELEPSLPEVCGSAQQIEQVLINLITNACYALPDRERAVTVASRWDRAADRVLIEVRDQGVGIAAEHLGHVLDPFFTTRQDEGGTGLGLSISYTIVRNHGGELRLASRVGEGTTATVALPRCAASEARP